MYQQANLFFYKYRFAFASIFTLTFLMLVSALVTTLGSHTVLDTNTRSSTNAISTSISSSPNAVTNAAAALTVGAQRAALSAGTTLYKSCRTITTMTARGDRSIAHGGAVIAGGTWNGAAFVARGIGGGVMFTLRAAGSAVMFTAGLPGRAASAITSGHAVSAIIKPADTKPVPTINDETSAAVLARLSAEQQQQIARLQAAQLAANRDLDGAVVAGDPNHGGYPAKWDDRAQDSTLDSWGMYNRECVSYAAWKVYQTFGYMPYWGGVGNANEWVRDAERSGITTGPRPRVHSVAISMRGYYGHAMWVEAVSGNMIYVSQYNYDLHGHYSEMWVNGSYFTYVYFK